MMCVESCDVGRRRSTDWPSALGLLISPTSRPQIFSRRTTTVIGQRFVYNVQAVNFFNILLLPIVTAAPGKTDLVYLLCA